MLLENKLPAQKTHLAMGTVMAHKAFGLHAEDCLEAVCSEIERIEKRLSRFLPGSDISRLNGSAGVKSEKVSHETFEVLSKAVEFSRVFPGCFDVTIEPMVMLWEKSKQTFTPPDPIDIQKVLALVDYRDLILNPWDLSAGLRNAGQAIDLGGIGKGFAGDMILDVYKNFGITSAYSNLGGNVVTLGAKPDGSPWHIGIQHPRQENQIIGSVSVVNQTVVTSGDYQRYFTDCQGKKYHHILNPTTGYPAASGLISVSIVAEKSMAADALSTILFLAGMEKGVAFLRGFPQTEAVLIDSAMQVYVTKGLGSRFQADKNIDINILD